MHRLDLKIPPPIVALIAAALMWLTAKLIPALHFPLPQSHLIALCIFLLGILISIVGVLSFRRAKTTVNPMDPSSASTLVVRGIYRQTRNPMYLGLLLGLLAWAIFLSSGVALLFLPLFALYITRFQIRPEESALATLFGEQYAAYKSRVRRWI